MNEPLTAMGYAAVLQNEDGTFSFGKNIHSTDMCAIASLDPADTRLCYGVAEVYFVIEKTTDTAASLQEKYASNIEAVKEAVAAGEVEGFSTLVKRAQEDSYSIVED